MAKLAESGNKWEITAAIKNATVPLSTVMLIEIRRGPANFRINILRPIRGTGQQANPGESK
jgi:hypothetical protein